MKVSLHTKFLLPLVVGAIVLIGISAAITYSTLIPELREQLYKRAELLVTTIRAASEINPEYQDLRLALEEITLETTGVDGITLATLEPTIIWASSVDPTADLDAHTEDMLNLLDFSSEHHIFGHYIHDTGDLIVITPFKFNRHISNTISEEVGKLPSPDGVTIDKTYRVSEGAYEGILYLRFGWGEIIHVAETDLVNHMLAVSTAILFMLVLSVVTVYKYIILPINSISNTIRGQQAGDTSARIAYKSTDEIGRVSQLINEMLDTLNNRDRLLRSVIDHLPLGLSLKDIKGDQVIQNSRYDAWFSELDNHGGIPESIQANRLACQASVIESEKSISQEISLPFGTSQNHFETTVFPIFNDENSIEWVGSLCANITEKKERDLKLTQLFMAVESVHNGIVICDAQEEGRPIIYTNPAVTKLTGYAKEELIGKAPYIFSNGSVDQDGLSVIQQALQAKTSCTVVIENIKKDGTPYWNEFTLSMIQNTEGEVTHLVGIQSDVSDRVAAENKIEHLAYFDALTDIPNRNLFNDRLTQVMSKAQRDNLNAVVMYIDLDGFKTANDTYGHATGDTLLKEATSRIQSCLREEDSVARVGGDEFTVLIPSLSVPDVITVVPKVAKRINDSLSEFFEIEKHTIHISCSIGISIYPKDGDTAEELVMNADHAMYHAKSSGKNTYSFFQSDMDIAIKRRQQIESSLRQATQNKEFSLYYQPQLSNDLNVVAAEALIRWSNADFPEISPEEFIPIAEQAGLIEEIGTWVIQQACADYAEFIKVKRPIDKVSINLSVIQLKRQNIVSIIRRYLEHYNVPASALEVEITETIIIDDFEVAKSVLLDLRTLGVTIAIDDFGTGYSSMINLKQLPIDTLKIDKQFIQGLPDDMDNVHIVKAIAGMAKGMGIELLAEGVETVEQLAFIRENIECSRLQGFLFDRALPKDQIIESGFTPLREGIRSNC